MQTHLKSIHTENEKQFKCLSCDKQFNRKQGLESHQQMHSTIKLYFIYFIYTYIYLYILYISCTLYTKTFQFRSGLDAHMLVHSSERPFKCQVCSFDCTDKGVLKRHHVCVHSKENPSNVKFVINSLSCSVSVTHT